MKMTADFHAPRLDLSKYEQMLREHLTAKIIAAAQDWLTATTFKIPIWTGASIATFLPLAQAASFPLTLYGRGSPLSLGLESRISLGLNNADGYLSIDDPKGSYTFTYSTTLAHLIWNEFNNANIHPDPTKWPPPAELINPGPYEFQRVGEMAFDRYAAGVRLPDPFLALSTKSIQVK